MQQGGWYNEWWRVEERKRAWVSEAVDGVPLSEHITAFAAQRRVLVLERERLVPNALSALQKASILVAFEPQQVRGDRWRWGELCREMGHV
jgi:hypothetical protein